MSYHDEAIHTEDYRGYRIKVFPDSFDHGTPKDNDDGMLSTFVTWHRNYSFDVDGTKEYEDQFRFWETLAGVFMDDLPDRDGRFIKGQPVDLEAGVEYKYKNKWRSEDEVKQMIVDLAYKRNVLLKVGMGDHSGIWLYEGGGAHMTDPGGWDSGTVGFIYCPKERFVVETGYSKDDLFSTDRNRRPKQGDHVRLQGIDYGKYSWGKVKRVEGEAFIVSHRGQGDRFSQLDYRSVRSEIVEVMADRALDMLRGELKRWDDYARNNIYGYKLYEIDEDGDDGEEIDSCWGFEGDYDEYMLDECKSIIDSTITQTEKEAAEEQTRLTTVGIRNATEAMVLGLNQYDLPSPTAR